MSNNIELGHTLLLELKHAPLIPNINYKLIPVTNFKITEEGAHNFNLIYDYMLSLNLNKIVRTKSGGISINKHNLRLPAYDVRISTSMVELTILTVEGMWRIQFRNIPFNDKMEITGSRAWHLFLETCKEFNLDINDFAIDNGKEVKKTIPKQKVEIMRGVLTGADYTNVHHMDFNSSHLSGMAEYCPSLRPVMQAIRDKKQQYKDSNPALSQLYKAILVMTWGYMQSSIVGYKFAHLSKAGIEYTNRMIDTYIQKLREAGRVPLLINTDGIWYTGDVYHDELEGTLLGQWKNDHTNCTLRIKSKGAYEFLENGQCNVVLRGRCAYDKIQPDRSKWEWGDLFKKDTEIINFHFVEGEGIYMEDIKL